MACSEKYTCEEAYRSGGNAVRCRLQQGGKWNFCAHQYMCAVSNRYEVGKGAVSCGLRKKKGENNNG